MVAIHILSNSENSANKIIDFLFENELIFEVVTMKEVTRRSKRAGTNHSAFLTIGITKALLFKQIAEEINARFIQDDPTVFSLPIVDMDPEKQKELINLTRSV
ncbi:MAG: hypothetical protein H6582_06780 [Crocinitomicaceae bacterium]|nr:hypothetical protein [Crocinitomicaceae bacterium]